MILNFLILSQFVSIYFTLGNSSNVWKGGGDFKVHSKVVAPSPQGLFEADFFFIKDGVKEKIRIFLKYDFKGNSVIENIKRVSRPGMRVYVGVGEAPRVLDGLGISILSTSKGVLSNKAAKKYGLGGEIICEVY